MHQKTYLSIFCKTYLFFLRITGIWPFNYDSQKKTFQFKAFYLIIPLMLIPYVLAIYMFRVEHLLTAVRVLFKNIVLQIVSNVFISLNVLNVIFLYGTQTSQYKKIKKLIYRIINHYENMCTWLPMEDMYYLPYLIKFTIKSMVFTTTLLAYMTISMTLIAPNVVNLYAMPGFLMPYVVNKFYPDLYYGGIILADFYLLQFNKDLKRIMSEHTAFVRNTSEEVNDNELADLLDQLDTVSINYIELIEIVKDFNRIMSFRVLLWIVIGVLNFLIHLFMQYVFIGIPIRYGHSLNILISAAGFVDISYQIMEFWLITAACSSIKKKVLETEFILTPTYITLRVNGSFERSVNMFISRIKQQNLQITSCGLFVLDSTLIYSIVSSVTSYLVFLIQYELAMEESIHLN